MLILWYLLNQTPQNRVLTRDPSTASELQMSAECPLSGGYRVSILENRLYDETTLLTRPLHLTVSSANKRCAELQLSRFIDLICYSN